MTFEHDGKRYGDATMRRPTATARRWCSGHPTSSCGARGGSSNCGGDVPPAAVSLRVAGGGGALGCVRRVAGEPEDELLPV